MDPLYGEGSPEGVVSAEIGTTYWDRSRRLLWMKHSGPGNTGWVAQGKVTMVYAQAGGAPLSGNGRPEGIVADIGTTYWDRVNKILYVKDSGNDSSNGWIRLVGV